MYNVSNQKILIMDSNSTKQPAAVLLAALSALTTESVAYLARVSGVAPTNLAAFIAGRKSSSVSRPVIDELLHGWGFSVQHERIAAGYGLACPVIKSHQVSEKDAAYVRTAIDLLKSQGFELFMHDFSNRAGYVLVIRRGDEFLWSAVAFEPKNGMSSTRGSLEKAGVTVACQAHISDDYYALWRHCGPRKDEVKFVVDQAIARHLREQNQTSTNLEQALIDIFSSSKE